MLKKIYCKEFKDGDEIRNIEFHPGLNTVMGSSNAKNSIGKTTFLLAVDFAFGGNDYVQKNDDMLNNVDNHTVFFTFEFSGNEYHFGRSTDDYMYVFKCDENYNILSKMTIQDYTAFLSTMYGVEKLGCSFRDAISGYFRIYGRNNHDEIHPLKAFATDKAEDGIRRILQLYGYYKAVADLEKNMKASREKLDIYKKARSQSFIRGVTNKKDYDANQARMSELEEAKIGIANDSTQDLLDLDSFQADRLSELKKQMANIRRERSRLLSRKNRMILDTEVPEVGLKKEFDDLREFFPDVNIQLIEDIEGFHRELSKVLKSEYNEAISQVDASIVLLDEQLDALAEEQRKINSSPSLTHAVLDKYSEIDRELSNLGEANEYFNKAKEYSDIAQSYEEQYQEAVKNISEDLCTELNEILRNLNTEVCGEHVQAPQMFIHSPKSYTYKIKEDSGTGSRTRGMFLLDLASLQNTPLPAVAEDSVSIKQIEDKSLLSILELFNKTIDKQCFIAIDKADSYSDNNSVPAILRDTIVLELSENHELYGRAWNKK